MKEADRTNVVRAALLILAACGWILSCPATRASTPAAGSEAEETFTLQEVSALEQGADNFLRGQYGSCDTRPAPAVRAYPQFKSAKPLYGMVSFPGTNSNPEVRHTYFYAFDESEGTGRGYDRLYFDLNRDLDLRNDPILKPRSDLPDAARLKYSNIRQQVLFDFLKLDFSLGPEGSRVVEIMPRLFISKYDREEYPQVNFVRTGLYRGQVKVGERECLALLGDDRTILGRLDQPGTALILQLGNSLQRAYWWGGDRLNGVQKIDGRFFLFSANPRGDRLTVSPYRGELGTFEIGAGDRKIETLTVTGSLKGKDRAVPVGGEMKGGAPATERSCRLPVGDYTPDFVTIRFGRLSIEMSENYHSDGRRQNRGGRPYIYGIAIRPDKPFVLDFSTPPAILFASPAREQRVKAGETLTVYAVLVDPKLDVMIRGLEDTSRTETQTAQGLPPGSQRNVSLNPHVIITRSDGAKVAEGVMPFG